MTEGTYPVMIDGVPVGKLSVICQGALTAFDVHCRAMPGIVRLSVYGGGREGYLGVLAPENGGIGLHKKFSRNDLRGFPQSIESVEPSGLLAERPAVSEPETTEAQGHEAAPEQAEEAKRPEKAETTEATEETEKLSDRDAGAACCDTFPVLTGALPPCAEACGFLCGDGQEACGQAAQDDSAAAPDDPEARAADDDLFWYASPDGALVCFDGTRSLIALPVGDERIPEGDGFAGVLRIVEGREYMIFRTKNGKLVREE